MTNDPFIPFSELEKDLNNLKNLLTNNNVNDVKILIEKLLKLYKPNSKIVDHIHVQRSLSRQNEQETISKNNKENKVIKLIQ